MTTEQLIKEIYSLKELDFASIVECVFERAIHENMSHVIEKEIDDRDFRTDEIELLHYELVESGDRLDKYAFEKQCSDLEIERLNKVIEGIKELVK